MKIILVGAILIVAVLFIAYFDKIAEKKKGPSDIGTKKKNNLLLILVPMMVFLGAFLKGMSTYTALTCLSLALVSILNSVVLIKLHDKFVGKSTTIKKFFSKQLVNLSTASNTIRYVMAEADRYAKREEIDKDPSVVSTMAALNIASITGNRNSATTSIREIRQNYKMATDVDLKMGTVISDTLMTDILAAAIIILMSTVIPPTDLSIAASIIGAVVLAILCIIKMKICESILKKI